MLKKCMSKRVLFQRIMDDDPRFVYLLVRKYDNGCFTAYTSGIDVTHIPNFSQCRIMRFYPQPPVDITHHFVCLQRRIRSRLRLRRWLGHPLRLRYRQLYGRWPPIPPSLRLQ